MAPKKQARTAVPKLNLPIFLVALFGVLVVVHLWVQVERGFTHGCLGFSAPTGEIAECAGVVGSEFGQIGPFSNVLLGLIFFLGIAAIRFGMTRARPVQVPRLRQASFVAVGVGLLYAIYLASVQLFQLDQYCVLCLVSGGTTLLLFGLHLVEWRSFSGDGSTGASGAFSMRPYAVAAVAVLVLAGADVVLTSNGDDPAPAFATEPGLLPTSDQLAEACQYDPQMQQFALFDLFTGAQAAYDGADAASGRALKIFDPNCPHCATLHTVLEHVVPEHRDRVRFYYQPIALWEYSVPQVQALYIAREHGNEAFLRMMDLQLERQRPGGMPPDTLVAYAAEIGLDAEVFRAELQRGKYVNVIRSDRQVSSGAGVNSVPKLFFEGRPIANTQVNWTTECLGYFAGQAGGG